jgi:hypothetical protein
MRSKTSCQITSRGRMFRLLSVGIFSLLAVGAVVGQEVGRTEQKLKSTLQAMQGNWEQNASESKSWGMDCSGTIKITRTLWLNGIDEERHSITGTYTREANGRLNTSSTIARALRAGPYGHPESCVFEDYNESVFYETRTYDVTITCSRDGDNCWLQAEESNCSGTCINHKSTLRIPVDGGGAFMKLGDWYFSRR